MLRIQRYMDPELPRYIYSNVYQYEYCPHGRSSNGLSWVHSTNHRRRDNRCKLKETLRICEG